MKAGRVVLMLDLHTHILPEMDDGAKDISESIKMVEMLNNQNVSTVCLTPHFYAYEESINEFLIRREKSYEILKNSLKDMDIKPEFLLASETYLVSNLFTIEDLKPLCIEDTRYLLIEMPFDFSRKVFDELQKLISNFSVKLIIAHIDRYPVIFTDKKLMEYLLDMGCFIQLNVSAFNGGFFEKRRIFNYVKNDYIHFLGTDCHNLSSRKPVMEEYCSLIKKKLGEDFFQSFIARAENIITGN